MKRILNVGCGSETYGTDFIDVYPQNQRVIKCNIEKGNFPFKNRVFDEVYSKNLFEHIPEPVNLLKEMKRVLKKKGKLVIITDNAGFILFHLPIRKNNSMQHYSNNVRQGDKDRHYFLFTPLHLKNLLARVGGFDQVEIEYQYFSLNVLFKFFKPLIWTLSKMGLENMVNPHLKLTAKKK